MACNILALSVTALIIFAVNAAIINVVTAGTGIITVNLTTLLTTTANYCGDYYSFNGISGYKDTAL